MEGMNNEKLNDQGLDKQEIEPKTPGEDTRPGTAPKLRCDAVWNSLSQEQKDQIEEWLFVRNLGYKTVHERSMKLFGIKWSLTSVYRIYKYLAAMRAINAATNVQAVAEEMTASGCHAEALNPSVMKISATRLLERAIENGDVREISVYGRLLMQGQTRELQRMKAELEQKRHEFQASQAALKLLPFLDEFTKDDEEREKARIAMVRRILFGPPTEENE